MFSNTTVRTLLAAAGILSGATCLAGPLVPAAGPVASTMKPLTDVEPRTAINAANTPGDADSVCRISQPGSYYLTGNLTGAAGKCGIEIATGHVTIDLNGFVLIGAGGSTDGVRVSAADASDITVQNGSVANWGGSGIDLVTQQPIRSTVRDIRSSDNGGRGIRVYTGSSVVGCSADYNVSIGIDTYANCRIRDCSAGNNNGNGIDSGSANIIDGCISTWNHASGIHSSNGCIVTGCQCSNNDVEGILSTSGSTIGGCVSNWNGGGGITVQSKCIIRDNSCTANSAYFNGIYATGGGNRIEANTCCSNGGGIVVDGANNFIIRNLCSGNTINWFIAFNNVYGPISNRAVPLAFPVNGDSAAGSLGVTDANANFTY